MIAAAAVALAAAGAVLVTGCSAPGTGSGSSVTSCAQYAVNAIRRHVTVTAIPAACRGLSQIDVNVAVARALHAAAAGVHGKARQRLIARDSQYLSGLVRTTPGARQPPAPVTAAAAAPPSRAAFGWATLAAAGATGRRASRPSSSSPRMSSPPPPPSCWTVLAAIASGSVSGSRPVRQYGRPVGSAIVVQSGNTDTTRAPDASVPRGQELAAGAGEVDVARNLVERVCAVPSLEQQPER